MERSFAPPDGQWRPSLRDFWWFHHWSGASLRWTDEGVRPYVVFGGLIRWSPRSFWSCDFRVLLVDGAENAICVLTFSWVGGFGARGRDRSSRAAGGRNAHREWRSHSPNA